VDDGEVPVLGSILGVWAHPDDEAYLSAGMMVTALDAGHRVCCVTATRGELGFPDDDPRSIDERMAIREAELDACLGDLGVTDHRWLDYPDGGCDAVDVDEVVPRLVAIIDEVRPDVVLAFGPDGATWHPDHIATSRWATLAARSADPAPRVLFAAKTLEWVEEFAALMDPDRIMMSEGALPPTVDVTALSIHTSLPDDLADRKLTALRRQVSQIEPLVESVGAEAFHRLMRWEMFREPTPDDWPG
jgi:LmbE family N-acetylglucosaminyl deacetylase